MNVIDAMTPRESVVTATLPGTRSDVLEQLQERTFSAVPVVSETENRVEYRGLVSRETLIDNPDEDQLVMLMETVPTTSTETPLDEVAELMVQSGARRVPVVNDEFEGIVTVTDVIHAIARGDQETSGTVGTYASRAVHTTYEGTPLSVAERSLSYARVPYTVVLDDDGTMCGILTEVDVIAVAKIVEGEEKTGDNFPDQDAEWSWEGVKAVGSRRLPTRDIELPTGPVGEFMTEDVVTVSTKTTVQDAAQRMISADVEQIPMMAGSGLAGIVRDVDLLKALYE